MIKQVSQFNFHYTGCRYTIGNPSSLLFRNHVPYKFYHFIQSNYFEAQEYAIQGMKKFCFPDVSHSRFYA